MSVLTQQYATFLQQFSWSYFLTARTPYKVNLQTPVNWSNRLLSNDKVERVFYSVERDKGDWTSKHVHMLVGTNKPMSYNETRSSLGNIAVGDYELIESPKAVTFCFSISWIAYSDFLDLLLLFPCCPGG